MNALATIGRFRHHPTFATHKHGPSYHEKHKPTIMMTSPSSFPYLAHSSKWPRSETTCVWTRKKKNEIKIVSVCVFVFQKKKTIAGVRFKRLSSLPTVDSDDTSLKKENRKEETTTTTTTTSRWWWAGGVLHIRKKRERKRLVRLLSSSVFFFLFFPRRVCVCGTGGGALVVQLLPCVNEVGPTLFFSFFFHIFFLSFLSLLLCVWSCFSSGGGLSVAAASGRRLLSGSPVALELPHPSHLIGWRPIGEQDACLHHRTAANTTRPKKKVQYKKKRKGEKVPSPPLVVQSSQHRRRLGTTPTGPKFSL